MEAEQSVLGAVFLDPDKLDDIYFLEPRDFYVERHRLIYRVMRYLHEHGRAVDLLTVAEEAKRFDKLGELGGVSYLSELAASCPTAENIVHYAKIVRKNAVQRRGIEIGHQIANMSRDDYESDEEYFAAIEQKIAFLRPQEMSGLKSIAETRDEYFRYLQEPPEFIHTGFRRFDEETGGVWRGCLYILAGRPSVGKTAKMLQLAVGIAQQNAGAVLVFSQEMSENSLKNRMIACLGNINYNRIRRKMFDQQEFDSIMNTYAELEKLPIYIDDASGVSIEEVRAAANRIKRKQGKVAAIIVDYLQIMRIPQRRGEERYQAIGRVVNEAKRIARDIGCCFILLSQLNRDADNKKEPQLSHLKESGDIEQAADIVEFLHHDPEETHPGGKVVHSIIAKGRDIGVHRFRLLFRGWLQRFEELPEDGRK